MPSCFRLALAVAAAALLAAAMTTPASAQERVGVSTGVNPDATGVPPQAAPRRLVLGQQIVYEERITTSPVGQTQILFLDQSSLSIGPNAEMVIDQFVYDPHTGTGKLAASVGRGVFRFVGGQLSKLQGAVTVRTETATIGIRGAICLFDQRPGGRLDVIFLYGRDITVTGTNGISQTLSRPDFAITVPGPGQSPSPPFPAPPGAAAQLLASLNGRAGEHGGATTVPSEAMVASSGIAQTISANLAASIAAAERAQGPRGTAPTVDLGSIGRQVLTADTGGQNAQLCPQNGGPCTSLADIVGRQIPPGSLIGPPSITVSVAGDFKSTGSGGSPQGFPDQSSSLNRAFADGTIANDRLTTALGGGAGGGLAIPLPAGFSALAPADTTSPLGPVGGSAFREPDGSFFYANMIPVDSPTAREFVAGGLAVDPAFYAPTGATRVLTFDVAPDAALQSTIPFLRANAGGNLPNAVVSPLFLVAPAGTAIGDATTATAARALQASLAISGPAASQQSAIVAAFGTVDRLQSSGSPILNGVVRGSALLSAQGTPLRIGSSLSSLVDANQNSFYGTNTIAGFAVDQTRFPEGASVSGGTVGPPVASSAAEVALSGTTTNYGFTQAAVAAGVPAGVGASRTTQTLTGFFGGVMNTTAQPQPYALAGAASISTDAGSNRVAATFSGADPLTPRSSGVSSAVLNFGGLDGNAGGREAFIDDSRFGAAESVNASAPQQLNGQTLAVGGDPTQAGQLYLLSSGAASPPASLLPGGAAYCTCAFLQWGYWGGDLRTGNASDTTISRIDRGHINFWVAGMPTPVADLATLAGAGVTGTYNGHIIGAVSNNGAQYVAAGGLRATFNFGTQTGSFAVNNFDGRSFTAAIARGSLNGASYTFGVNQAGLTGTVSGAFYGPMAAETGGNFALRSLVGPSYLTSGIFAAKR